MFSRDLYKENIPSVSQKKIYSLNIYFHFLQKYHFPMQMFLIEISIFSYYFSLLIGERNIFSILINGRKENYMIFLICMKNVTMILFVTRSE